MDATDDVVPQHHSDYDDHCDQVQPVEDQGHHIRWHPVLNGACPRLSP